MTTSLPMRVAKCTLLFFTATMLHGIGRDFVQALVTSRLGVPHTLYHYFVVYEHPASSARDLALIYGAPILFSVVLAMAAFWMYERGRSAAVSVFALYLAGAAAIGSLGTVMSIGLEGRAHDIAELVGIPMAVQVSLSITAGLILFVAMWQVGARLQPPVGAMIVPFVAATIARAIAYAPLPLGMLVMLVGGSLFWLVAGAGSVWYRRTGGPVRAPLAPVNLMLSAYTLPILLILIVRLMTLGIRFGA